MLSSLRQMGVGDFRDICDFYRLGPWKCTSRGTDPAQSVESHYTQSLFVRLYTMISRALVNIRYLALPSSANPFHFSHDLPNDSLSNAHPQARAPRQSRIDLQPYGTNISSTPASPAIQPVTKCHFSSLAIPLTLFHYQDVFSFPKHSRRGATR